MISVLAFSVVTSVLLAGVATFTLSHISRAYSESYYVGALDLAEAGVNFEIRAISQSVTNADQYNNSTGQGVTYSFGKGSYTIYCTNKDGSTPWIIQPDPTTGIYYFYVISTGTLNGVSRTVKVLVKGHQETSSYWGTFAVTSGSFAGNTLTSSVGTNGTLDAVGSTSISGNVSFNGLGSGWVSGSLVLGSPITYSPNPIPWLTVDQIANQKFPAGGLAWLAAHNDNSLVSNIVNKQISVASQTVVTFIGKPGGANYYLTSMSFTGQSRAAFDNTNGPINLWIGPSGGSGLSNLAGGSAAISASADPAKECRIYVATTTGITMAGGSSVEAGIYAYNKNSLGVPYGTLNNAGGSTIKGEVIANTITLSGGATINSAPGYFHTASPDYYGFANSWLEQNGM